MIIGAAVVYFFRYANERNRKFAQENSRSDELTNLNTNDQIHTEDTDQV